MSIYLNAPLDTQVYFNVNTHLDALFNVPCLKRTDEVRVMQAFHSQKGFVR